MIIRLRVDLRTTPRGDLHWRVAAAFPVVWSMGQTGDLDLDLDLDVGER